MCRAFAHKIAVHYIKECVHVISNHRSSILLHVYLTKFITLICILGRQHFKVADARTDLLLGRPRECHLHSETPFIYAPVHRVLTTGPICFDLCNQGSTHIN